MILTPIPAETMPEALATFERLLAGKPLPLAAFRRIAATWPVAGGVDTPAHRAEAVRLATHPLPPPPADTSAQMS